MNEVPVERDDRQRQVETRKRRHGEETYKDMAAKSPTLGQFSDPEIRRRANLKRWHKDWFDDEGNLKEEHK